MIPYPDDIPSIDGYSRDCTLLEFNARLLALWIECWMGIWGIAG